LWDQREPCYEDLLRDARSELEGTDADQSRRDLLEFVVQRLLDRRRRRVVSSEEKLDADLLLREAEQTGQIFDSDDFIRQMAGSDQNLLDRYVEVSRLVRRRLAQVETWDGMIVEPVPADLGELHMSAVKGVVGALIPQKLHERFDKAAAKQKLPKDVPQGGTYLRCDGWRVSVYEESLLLAVGLASVCLSFFSSCWGDVRHRCLWA
jgi:hypothetical protein